MDEGRAKMVEREVGGWPGVTVGDTGRGGTGFYYGGVELGHLHGGSFADLPFPKKVRDELIAEGRASVHSPLPDSLGLGAPQDGKPRGRGGRDRALPRELRPRQGPRRTAYLTAFSKEDD